MRPLLEVLATSLFAFACGRSLGPSEEFSRAEKALGAVMSETLDPTYGDPRFDAVIELFRAVPESARERAQAETLASKIEAGRKTARDRERSLEEAAKSPPPAPAPPVRAEPPRPAIVREVKRDVEEAASRRLVEFERQAADTQRAKNRDDDTRRAREQQTRADEAAKAALRGECRRNHDGCLVGCNMNTGLGTPNNQRCRAACDARFPNCGAN